MTTLSSFSNEQIIAAGGPTLLTNYNRSSTYLVLGEYPEYAWNLWEFERTPKTWWQEVAELLNKGDPVGEAVIRNYIDKVAKRANIEKPEDWYSFVVKQPDASRIAKFGTLPALLGKLYPHYQWKFPSQPQLFGMFMLNTWFL